MKRNALTSGAAMTGAVIGAGFASGREIAVFFSRYGAHGWWLAGLAVALMVWLCVVCEAEAIRTGSMCWCGLFAEEAKWIRTGARLVVSMLLCIMGGSMIAASGHLVALMWASPWAYSLGAVGTMAAAWFLGFGSMKPLSILSGVLTALLLGAMLLARQAGSAAIVPPLSVNAGIREAVRAAAYAAMNLTLAMGVVCRCAHTGGKMGIVVFGVLMAVLTGMAHAILSTHPEWMDEAFPLVRMLGGLGRGGFWLSTVLLYLSILTSLAAVLYALRCAFEPFAWGSGLSLGLPLLISLIGFEGIVDHVYAPAGLVCLLVFAPLIRRRWCS